MKYAVVLLGGKQIKISEGDVFEIERQEKLEMPVMLFSDDGKVEIGTPILENVEVKAGILENKLDKKIIVARFKSKSRYRKRKGHRQPISVIKIESISKKGQTVKKKDEKAVKEEKAEKQVKKTSPKVKKETSKAQKKTTATAKKPKKVERKR
jgi:large subunit ribosomal protein L21